jgi:hypothetical protein
VHLIRIGIPRPQNIAGGGQLFRDIARIDAERVLRSLPL